MMEATMKTLLTIAVMATLAAAPCFAQVVAPHEFPPPCSSDHCLTQQRGAITTPPGASPVQKIACPKGTVYNPNKGTCKVLPGQ